MLLSCTCLALACAEGGTEDTESDSGTSGEIGTKSDGGADSLFPLDEAGDTGDTSVPPPPTDSGSDAPSCGPGMALCGGKCIPTYNDVDNCGGCGIKCPDVPSAVRTCVASACGYACNAGKGSCDGDDKNGCETDLNTSTSHCGACGKACSAKPNADATCSGGACSETCKAGFASLSGYCTSFAGAFETHAPACTTCNDGNGYTSGCSCPAGFSASSSYLARNDACSALRAASIQFCETSGLGSSVWGGAYQADDPVGCAVSCRVSNPKTGGCSCPAGFSATAIRVLIKNSCSGIIGSQIVVCIHPTAALDNFGGGYEEDDPVSGGLGCRVKHPRTGGCSCPSGFSPHGLRTTVDISGGGEIGAHAQVCTR